MRGMNSRQATKRLISLLTLLAFITACSTSEQPLPTSSPNPPPPNPSSTPTQTPVPATATATPTSTPSTPACLTQPGRMEKGVVDTTNPPQAYLIYLPPCYDENVDTRYPVLYLLHGQTYTADQWVRLGVPDALDPLIHSGQASPFIIVFPDDRYWNLEAGPGFGDRLINALIPHIDETYRTLANRDQRAIGGLSRGAGWALRLGLSHWELFSIIGLHSLAVFQGDGSQIETWLGNIPSASYPVIFMDIGDNDQGLAQAQQVETLFTNYGVPHTWHLYGGAHTEAYWRSHVPEYIEWYANRWNMP